MCETDTTFTTKADCSALGNFRALPTPDLVASSVATARPNALRQKARPSAVVGAGATGGSDGQVWGLFGRRLCDRRVASVADGETETQQEVLVGTNLPELWGKATVHPRFICPNLFRTATFKQSWTYKLGTVLRPGPRPPDSKLVRRRLLRSLRGPGVFYAHAGRPVGVPTFRALRAWFEVARIRADQRHTRVAHPDTCLLSKFVFTAMHQFEHRDALPFIDFHSLEHHHDHSASKRLGAPPGRSRSPASTPGVSV